MTFQKTDPTAPLASHPCLCPQEVASAGMRVPEAGSEAGAGPGESCLTAVVPHAGDADPR